MFAENARKYWENGFSVMPLRPNSKDAFLRNWPQFSERLPTEAEIDLWESFSDCNIGVCLGIVSRIVALDFDNDVNGLHSQIEALIPPSPVKKRGAKGYTAFYRYTGQTNHKWSSDGQVVMELLSNGRQTVLPPSIHPDTKQPYVWLTPDALGDVELPELPYGFVKQVNDLFGITEKSYQRSSSTVSGEMIIDRAELQAALNYVPAHEYAIWVQVGMALHHTALPDGFALWDAWSRTAPNYKPSETDFKWQSFGRRSDVVTINSIFHLAIAHGWNPPAPEPEELMITFDEPSAEPQAGLPEFLNRVPGLPGKIKRWIDSTARRHQPVLSLGASLAAAGALYGHRVRTETDLRSNIYALGISPSGTGKDHPLRAIESLFNAIGERDLIAGDFASGQAMVVALNRRNGRMLCLMDEIGKEFEKLTHRNASGWQAEVMTFFTKAFSAASTSVRGREYADPQAQSLTIDQPCLCAYGASEPAAFYASLKSSDVISGFLPRWLTFINTDARPERRRGGDIQIPPDDLIQACRAVLDMPYLDFGQISPTTIFFSDIARDIWASFELEMDDLRAREIETGKPFAAIYARGAEHAAKIALVCHEGGLIESTVMQWSCDLTRWLIAGAVKSASENIADSEWQAFQQRIVKVVADAGEIPEKALLRRFSSSKLKETREAISQLVETGGLDFEEKTAKNGKVYKIYRVRG